MSSVQAQEGPRATVFEEGGPSTTSAKYESELESWGAFFATFFKGAVSPAFLQQGTFSGRASLLLAFLALLLAWGSTLAITEGYRKGSCNTKYVVLPNEAASSGDPVDVAPPALVELVQQTGVTILARSLIAYSNETTFVQLGASYWAPLAVTCGCDACNLLSCSATVPLSVTYRQCLPYSQAFALAFAFFTNVLVASAVVVMTLAALCEPSRRAVVEGSTALAAAFNVDARPPS
ncbi:unnamed protein product [Phaeothamnion confervicola]